MEAAVLTEERSSGKYKKKKNGWNHGRIYFNDARAYVIFQYDP
ncbi:hypothetical protein [Paenibacillus vortex]|nr:hypothetical protein [Paenibacillus vortex]